VSKKYLETIRVFDGVAQHLEYHQERVDNTLETKNIHILSELIKAPSLDLYRCRIVYDRESISIEYLPYVKRDIRTLKLLRSDSLSYDKKYENREELLELFARKEQCDDILIVKNNCITDTSIANIALFNGVRWYTPKTPLLKGTTRARLLAEGKITEVDIPVERLKSFKKIALMNAMINFDIIAEENIGAILC